MKIFPAIDLIDGKCVRLTKGDYNQKKIYNEDPLEVALEFQDHGITHLHLVDLDGAKKGAITNWKVLEQITSKTQLKVDFGGGLKTNQDLKIAFDSGANQITAGTVAIKNEPLFLEWLGQYGGDKIILGADVKNERIATHGWQQTSDVRIWDFLAKHLENGIQYCICTDISKDGMLEGTSLDLYRDINSQFPKLACIASGGVTAMEELDKLKEIGCFGAIIGKAIYENKISLSELEKWIINAN